MATATMPDSYERAQRAVAETRRLLPQLTHFAKALTGKNVNIVLTGGTPCTNGDTIYLRPALELGDLPKHDFDLCDERDDDDVLLCPACRAREFVLIVFYHEISHIRADSFRELSPDDKREILERALVEAGAADGTTRAAKIRKRIETIGAKDYMEAAVSISPFLPMLINALEDARVNAEMYRARPGTFPMFRGLNISTFKNGTENQDGTRSLWKDQPKNAQAIIGCYAIASGIEVDDYLADDVVEALRDDELRNLLARCESAQNVAEIYHLSFPVLERLRAGGFCKAPNDPEDEPEPQPSPEGDPDDERPGQEQQDSDGTAPSPDEDEGNASEGDEASDGDGSTSMDDADGGDQEGEDVNETGNGDGDGDAEVDGADQDDQEGASDGDTGGEVGGAQDAQEGAQDDAQDDADPDPLGNAQDDADSDDDADDESVRGSAGSNENNGGEVDDDADDADVPYNTENDLADESMGSPEDVERALNEFTGHNNMPGVGPSGGTPPEEHEPVEVDQEIDRALNQDEFFDAPSMKIYGVQEIESVDDVPLFMKGYAGFATDRQKSSAADIKVHALRPELAPETILAPALQKLRVTFAENRRAKRTPDLKSGSVDARVLGRRVMTQDPRLFYKKTRPGKRDWFVLIGMDVSGSTMGRAIHLLKQSVLAQAELLHRLGVDFAIYAHDGQYAIDSSGEYHRTVDGDYELVVEIMRIKAPNDPWGPESKQRLADVLSSGANLDGHTLEYYRKVAERQPHTDKMILYYTDGAMPCENYREELAVLQENIALCRRKNISLVGIGVGNDEPTKHGLDTVRIDTIEEIPRVIEDLKKRLDRRES